LQTCFDNAVKNADRAENLHSESEINGKSSLLSRLADFVLCKNTHVLWLGKACGLAQVTGLLVV